MCMFDAGCGSGEYAHVLVVEVVDVHMCVCLVLVVEAVDVHLCVCLVSNCVCNWIVRVCTQVQP